MLADGPAALANEGPVPLSKSPLIHRVIVLPNEEQEGSKRGGGDKSEDRQWRRRHGRRIRREGIHVKDQPGDAGKYQRRPADELEV